MSWDGDRVALPARWPEIATGRVESPFTHRAYLNTCTFGYTTPWWGWPRWEREIDWMAVHGIGHARWPWRARNMSGGRSGAGRA